MASARHTLRRVTTTEREITSEVELAAAHERLNPQAVGWTRRPLHIPNLRIRRRVKAWEYWGIVTPRHVLGLTVSNISYAGVLGVYLLDRQTGKDAAHDAVVSPKTVQLPPRCGQGMAVGKAKDFSIAVRHGVQSTAIEVIGPSLIADLEVDFPAGGAGRDSLGVVVPWDRNLFQYTVKDVGRPVRGSIILGSSAHAVSAEDSFAVLDHGRGRWPYRVTWNWAAGSRPGLALNLGGRWTDGTGSTENGVFVEGRLHKIGADLTWEYDRTDWLRPWRIHGPGVDVRFEPFHERIAGTNLGLVANETHQCFGGFSGWVEGDGGERFDVGGLTGWAEEARNRW